MRIKITENQYKSLLTEQQGDRLFNKIKEESHYRELKEVLHIVFNKYALSSNMVKSNEKLNEFLTHYVKFYAFKAYNSDYGRDIIGRDLNGINTEGHRYVDDVVDEFFNEKIQSTYDIKNPLSQLKMLAKINDSIGKVLSDNNIDDHIIDTMEGLLDDVIEHLFKNSKTTRGVVKELSIIKKLFYRNSNISDFLDNTIQRVGKKDGLVLVKKPLTWTFEKGGGRVQQVLDYIKEQPKLPKKTRRGWMEYVGEDPNRKGWNSYMWSAIIDAGIVVPIRQGRDTIYQRGPNADAFEQGKLVGY